MEGDDLGAPDGGEHLCQLCIKRKQAFFISAPVSLNLRFITWQKLFQPCCDVIDLCDRIRHGEPNVRVLLMLVPRMTMRLLLFMLVLRVFTEDFNPFTRRDHGQGG